MKKVLKRVRRSIFYIISVSLGTYIIVTIGPADIYREFISVDIVIVLLALNFSFLASVIRIYKFKLLSGMDNRSIMEIFISSRLGKEVSFAGYFIPLIEKKNQQNNTFKNLIVDRYTEIFCTLVFSLIACFFVLRSPAEFEIVIFISITTALIFIIAIPFTPVLLINRITNKSYIVKLTNSIRVLQNQLKLNSGLLVIYGLSAVSTIFDFLSAQYVFRAYGIKIDLFHISITWAASGLISMIAFMIIGSTEVSVIYLYDYLSKIKKSITASFIIVSRVINILVLIILFLFMLLFTRKKKSFNVDTPDFKEWLSPIQSTPSGQSEKIT